MTTLMDSSAAVLSSPTPTCRVVGDVAELADAPAAAAEHHRPSRAALAADMVLLMLKKVSMPTVHLRLADAPAAVTKPHRNINWRAAMMPLSFFAVLLDDPVSVTALCDRPSTSSGHRRK